MPPRRPGSVTAAGVMAVIYGSLFTLCGLCGVIGLAAQSAMGDNLFAGGDPVQDALFKHAQQAVADELPEQAVLQPVGTLIGFGVAIVVLIAGIGLLSMRRWARSLALAICLFAIAVNVAQVAYQLVRVLPATNRAVQALPAALPPNAGPQDHQKLQFTQFTLNAATIGAVVVLPVIVIYLVIIVILLRREHVRAAFAAEGQPGEESRFDNDRIDQRDDDEWQRPTRD